MIATTSSIQISIEPRLHFATVTVCKAFLNVYTCVCLLSDAVVSVSRLSEAFVWWQHRPHLSYTTSVRLIVVVSAADTADTPADTT